MDRPLIAPPLNETAAPGTTDTAATKWFNNIYWGYSGRGVIHSEQYFDDMNSSFIEGGMANQVHISAPQKLFKYITISPNASANLSTLRGAIDTAVLRVDTAYDTITYAAPHIADTTLHPGFRTINYANGSPKLFDTTLLDTSGTLDTSFGIREVSITPGLLEKHDTSKTAITNDFGWNAGASMSTNLYGILPIHILNFDGLRHTFSPSISYTYVPLHNLDKTFYPLGLSYEGAHNEEQLISYSLGNQFDGKILKPSGSSSDKPEEVKFPILTANITGTYDFEAKARKFSDIGFSATTGYHFLGVNYSSDYWFYKDKDFDRYHGTYPEKLQLQSFHRKLCHARKFMGWQPADLRFAPIPGCTHGPQCRTAGLAFQPVAGILFFGKPGHPGRCFYSEQNL